MRAALVPAGLAVALLAASGWLAEPRVRYLAACAFATGASAIALARYAPRAGRMAYVVVIAALAILSIVGGRAQWRFGRFTRSPAEVGKIEATAQRVRLGQRVDEELRTLRAIAAHARGAPPQRAAARSYLEHDLADRGHRATLIFRADSLFTWAGTLHADPRRLRAPVGIAQTPFGLTLYVSEDSGGVRVLAASLLYAYSPADHLTRGLAQRLASGEVAEGFEIVPPTNAPADDELRYLDRGRPLFVARALIPSSEEVKFRLLERARVRAGIALLIALLAFLVAIARAGGGWLIAGGAAVVLHCLAVVRLSEFSSRSRLFDAAVYFNVRLEAASVE